MLPEVAAFFDLFLTKHDKYSIKNKSKNIIETLAFSSLTQVNNKHDYLLLLTLVEDERLSLVSSRIIQSRLCRASSKRTSSCSI
jgi:hypothetical protein